MKRYAFYMLVMAVAVVAACQKQAGVEEPVAQEPTTLKTYTYTINASVADTDVKSDYDADGKFSWSTGDAISVLFHKGDVNKFFTLTTTADGTASGSFSGEIEEGYVIGASDQTGEDKMIWVLYPASTKHSYVAEDAKPARFYMEPETDFTALGAHWSANMPMYDLLADEGLIAFKNMAVGYKFTITDIDPAVTKVQFIVENQNLGSSWYALSGTIKIHAGDVYLDHSGANSTTAVISYIGNVDALSHKAVFYVPFRYYASGFKPIITIKDHNTGNLIKTVTATKVAPGIESKGKVLPITVSAPGTGTPPASINVDWSDAGIQTFAGINDRIVAWDATSDADYIYFRYKFTKSKYKKNGSSKFYIGFNTDNNDATGGSGEAGINAPGLEALVYFYPWIDGDSDGNPSGYVSGEDVTSWIKRPVDTLVDGKVLLKSTEEGSYVYIEVGIPRSCLAITEGATVKVQHDVQWGYRTNIESVTF